MKIEYTDVNSIFQELTPKYLEEFQIAKSPHTYYARSDRRDVIEPTHYGVETTFTFRVSFIEETEIADYKNLLLAIENLQDIVITDPDDDMPENDFPITAIRTDSSVPVLTRMNSCKLYEITCEMIVR